MTPSTSLRVETIGSMPGVPEYYPVLSAVLQWPNAWSIAASAVASIVVYWPRSATMKEWYVTYVYCVVIERVERELIEHRPAGLPTRALMLLRYQQQCLLP